MKDMVLIFGGIVALILFIFVLLYVRLLLIIKKRTQEAAEALRGEKIFLYEESAKFMGQKSAGLKQTPGNGFLALTADKLYFKMWFPNKTLMIPVNYIINAQKDRNFLGQTKRKPLLKVAFYRNNGLKDEVAWLVREPERWIHHINKLLKAI